MFNKCYSIFSVLFIFAVSAVSAQCTIDTTNRNTGFTPGNPAVVRPGVPYSQTAQVYVPPTYAVTGGFSYIVDSLHIDSLTGMPSGFSYILNPSTGTVLGGQNGAICYSGTTNDTVGPYPITFYGDIYTNAGIIPFSYLVTLAPSFGYKFRVETAPVAAFVVDSPACSSDTVKFTDLSGGYPTGWAWKFAGGTPATSTRQFPAIVYDSAGTYTVRLIAKNGISADTITQQITVNPGVTGSISTVPAITNLSATGSAAVLAGGGTPPFTYLWTNSATTDSITHVLPATYGLSVTDTKGCRYVNDTVKVSYIVFINGVANLGLTQTVNIYPNPASNVLNLVWSDKPNAQVSIIDMNGSVIRTYSANSDMKSTYNLEGMATGSYLLRIKDYTTGGQQTMLFTKF